MKETHVIESEEFSGKYIEIGSCPQSNECSSCLLNGTVSAIRSDIVVLAKLFLQRQF